MPANTFLLTQVDAQGAVASTTFGSHSIATPASHSHGPATQASHLPATQASFSHSLPTLAPPSHEPAIQASHPYSNALAKQASHTNSPATQAPHSHAPATPAPGSHSCPWGHAGTEVPPKPSSEAPHLQPVLHGVPCLGDPGPPAKPRHRPSSLQLNICSPGPLLSDLRKSSPVKVLQDQYLSSRRGCAAGESPIEHLVSVAVAGEEASVTVGGFRSGAGVAAPYTSQSREARVEVRSPGAAGSSDACNSTLSNQRTDKHSHDHALANTFTPATSDNPVNECGNLKSDSSKIRKIHQNEYFTNKDDVNSSNATVTSLCKESKCNVNADVSGGESVARDLEATRHQWTANDTESPTQHVGVALLTRPHGSLFTHNLEKLNSPSVVSCHAKHERTLSKGDSKRDPAEMDTLLSFKAGIDGPQRHKFGSPLVNDYQYSSRIPEAPPGIHRPNRTAGIAMNVERIIEQTRKLSSTTLNNLDSPTQSVAKSNIYDNKVSNLEGMARLSPESNTSIEKDSLDEKTSSSNEEVSSEECIVHGRLSIPVEIIRKTSSSSGNHDPIKAEQEQATTDTTVGSRPLAATQTKMQNNDVTSLKTSTIGRSRQPLQQPQQSEQHQERVDPPCPLHQAAAQLDMGSVFSKNKPRGSSQPPITPSHTQSPVSSVLIRPSTIETRLNDPKKVPYNSQRSEPSRRYSGFSHVTSDNVRRMRDVWGSRQEKPPAGPPLGTSPLSRSHIAPRTPTPQRHNSPSSRPTACTHSTSRRSPSPNPHRSSPSHNSNSDRIERNALSSARRPRDSGSNSPSGRNAVRVSDSPSRNRISQSPIRMNNKHESTDCPNRGSRSSSATRAKHSPEKIRSTQSPTKMKSVNTPPASPSRKTFPTHMYDNLEKDFTTNKPSTRSTTASNNTNNGSVDQTFRVSPPGDTGSPHKSSPPRASSKGRTPATPNRSSSRSAGTATASSGTATASPESASEVKKAPTAHKKIFKRFRDASLRPDSETLCFVEQEDRYKVRSSLYFIKQQDRY